MIEYANKYYVSGLPTIPEQFKKDTKYIKDMSKLGKDKFNKPLKGGYEGVGLIAEDELDGDGDM